MELLSDIYDYCVSNLLCLSAQYNTFAVQTPDQRAFIQPDMRRVAIENQVYAKL